jgi:general secretion pathway protein K
LEIEDLQSKLNVNDLIKGTSEINFIQLERMISLFDQLDINQDLLYALIDWIDSDSETITSDGAEDDHYLNSRPAYRSANNYIINLDEILLIKGFDKTILRKLKPHLTAIPNQYKTNINTINSETISSLHPMIGLINAEKIIRHRNESPFKNIKDFAFFLKYDLRLSNSAINEITSMMTTKSENFRIYGKITMSGHNLDFLTNVFHSLDTLQFVKHNRVIQKIELM